MLLLRSCCHFFIYFFFVVFSCNHISSPGSLVCKNMSTISDKSLSTPSHFCNICRGNLSVRSLSPSSMLFIVMKSSLPVYNNVGRGGEGAAYSYDVMRYWLNYLVNAFSCYLIEVCQGIFVVDSKSLSRNSYISCPIRGANTQ